MTDSTLSTEGLKLILDGYSVLKLTKFSRLRLMRFRFVSLAQCLDSSFLAQSHYYLDKLALATRIVQKYTVVDVHIWA